MDSSARTSPAIYHPQSRNGAVLVTSRSKDAAVRLARGYNDTKPKEVLAMYESEGLQLLRNKKKVLLRLLACIPLAIS